MGIRRATGGLSRSDWAAARAVIISRSGRRTATGTRRRWHRSRSGSYSRIWRRKRGWRNSRTSTTVRRRVVTRNKSRAAIWSNRRRASSREVGTARGGRKAESAAGRRRCTAARKTKMMIGARRTATETLLWTASKNRKRSWWRWSRRSKPRWRLWRCSVKRMR